MPITKGQFGEHQNVTVIEFGFGDVSIVKMREETEEHQSMVTFVQNETPRQIGEESEEFKGKVSDKLPEMNTVLKFNNPQSITALIHTLVEIQQSMYGKNKQ